jgi:type IV secretory pathway TrbD component
VAAEKTADEIQRDIEQARTSLASAVDQLAERTSPKRIVNDTKQNLIAKAKSPGGMAIIGGTAAALIGLVLFRILRGRSPA